jgi:hypothetical protein
MVRPFKVFTHLLDSSGAIVGQHDALPGGGCCLAHTWTEGEVIIDEHVIPLDAALPPGTYRLVAGMYDEGTDSRLPAYDSQGNKLAHDRVPIQDVIVESAPDAIPGNGGTPPPTFEFDHRIYIPLLLRGYAW